MDIFKHFIKWSNYTVSTWAHNKVKFGKCLVHAIKSTAKDKYLVRGKEF